MDTAKLLIPVAVALALNHLIEEQQPACGVEPVKAAACVMACHERQPSPLHLEPGHVGPHPFNAIPGFAIPGLARPGVGYYGPEPEPSSYARRLIQMFGLFGGAKKKRLLKSIAPGAYRGR